MGKRGNGEGSIYQRKDGRWVGQYVVQMADGPKYRYIYGKTRKAVAERLTKAMADRDGGLVFEAGTSRWGSIWSGGLRTAFGIRSRNLRIRAIRG